MLILRRFLGYLRRIIRFFIRFLNSLKWRMLFKYFGRNSQLISPLRLDGTENIIIGDYVSVGYKTWLAALPLTGEKECVLELQDRVTIGHFNHIFSTKRIVIESDVITAGKVYISDNLHGYKDVNTPIQNQPIVQNREVVIGEGSWLGVNVCILGAKVGKHCVVGANSVVTKDIPDYCVAVGAPAYVIKRYDFVTNRWQNTNKNGDFLIQ